MRVFMFTSTVALRELFLPYLLISLRNQWHATILNLWTLTELSALERNRYQQCREQRIKLASVPLSLHRPAASESTASPESHGTLAIPPRAPQSLLRPLSVAMATRRLTSSLCRRHKLIQSLRNNLHYSSRAAKTPKTLCPLPKANGLNFV